MKWIGKLLLICFLLVLIPHQYSQAQTSAFTKIHSNSEVHSDIIVIKFKNQETTNGKISTSTESQLKKLKNVIGGYASHHQIFENRTISDARLSSSALENIYKITLSSGANIWQNLAKLQKLDFIAYAEPLYINELLIIPNDPEADSIDGKQYYLSIIKAYEGWDIDQSDSTMVIGIVDTGVNMDHEDLGNIAYNFLDPVNGVDDDGDGYIDNYFGWDIADNDNDPTADGNPHGTAVTGMAAAKTNNEIGIAGIGFKSKFLPVKIGETSSRQLVNEYEGIIYAADHGCKVINLSWGGAGSLSKFGQDIINYAVLEKDVVVVAAAGNTHKELNFYPSSFENVLSVGATNNQDNLAPWATYSHFIDIMAPGDKVFTTKNNGNYGTTTGSSFSAPLVSGAAALVRSHFPELSALQVIEQLRVTADDISDVGSNMDYYGMMGKGRLNVRNALSNTISPSIRLSNILYNTSYAQLVFAGDSVHMKLTFTNYLRDAENVTITISNPSANISWEIDPIIVIGKLSTLESYQTDETELIFTLNQDVVPGDRLLFRVDFVGNNYVDFQYFEIFVTPEFIDISDGNLIATITSDGDIGYDLPMVHNGNGISYKEKFIATNAGLIISLDSTHVLDNVINDFDAFTKDQDFVTETHIKPYQNSIADHDYRSVFKPIDTLASSLNIKVEQKILAWNNDTNDGYLIFEYRIVNTGDTVLAGINAGLFADWDLGQYQSNAAKWDTVDNFGYVFNKSSNDLFSGIALLSNQSKTHFAIDLISQNGNVADLDTVFDDKLKYKFLTFDSLKNEAGFLGAGNDVAQIIGGKGIDIAPKQGIKIAFAMLASRSLDGLKSALNMAKSNYTNYIKNPPIEETFYVCLGDSTTIDPKGDIYEFYSDPETTQKIDSGFSFKTRPVLNNQSYYAINLDSGYAGDIMKINVITKSPEMGFEYQIDTINLEEKYLLNIYNTQGPTDSITWLVNDIYKSSQPTFNYNYNQETLEIIQIKHDQEGCTDTLKMVIVQAMSPQPIVNDVEICKNASLTIKPENGDIFYFYKDIELNNLLHKGRSWTLDDISNPDEYFITGMDGLIESTVASMKVFIDPIEAIIQASADTLDLKSESQLELQNVSKHSSYSYWQYSNGDIDTSKNIVQQYDTVGNYNYTLIVESKAGCLDTARLTINVKLITALNEGIFENLVIYPNPASDILTIEFGYKVEEDIEFELIDLSGKRIDFFKIAKNTTTYQYDLSTIKKGIYLIKSLNFDEPIISKIIKY